MILRYKEKIKNTQNRNRVGRSYKTTISILVIMIRHWNSEIWWIDLLFVHEDCKRLCLFAYALAPILTFKENFGKKNLLKRNCTQTSLRSPAYLDRNSHEIQSTFFVIQLNSWNYNWSRRTTKYIQLTDHNTCDNMTIIVLVNRRAKTSFNA